MRILFIKQLWNPEPTAKSLDFALELKRRGHDVQVLTGFPSYPLGRIYDGYRQKLWRKEEMEGISVIRVPIYPDHSSNGTKRILHYLFYAISASIIGPWLVEKPDVAFVYQGAIPVGIPATFFKWFRGVPFVYDINDLWPETVAVSGMIRNSFLLKIINAWCNFNYRQASHISVATPGFKQRLYDLGVEEHKLTFVSNWSRDKHNEHKRKFDFSPFPNVKMNILYAGNLGIVQRLDVLLKSAEMFKDDARIHFNLLGGGADETRLKSIASEKKLENVTFHSRVPSDEVAAYLYSADILFVHLKSDPLFEITIPSKILSYLRTGKPILMGMKGNASDIIKDSNAGLLFTPEDPISLSEKISELLNMSDEELESMGSRGPEYYEDNLSLESSTNKLENLFYKVMRK